MDKPHVSKEVFSHKWFCFNWAERRACVVYGYGEVVGFDWARSPRSGKAGHREMGSGT